MERDEHEEELDSREAELLPPREALSLLNTDPTSYGGLLADPTGGAADAATSTASDAHTVADAQASASDDATISDQPQTITVDDTETASSQT